MLQKIEQWIDQTNREFQSQQVCCAKFAKAFEGFYPLSFLEQAYFVVVDKVPKPDFPELRNQGLGDFIDMVVDGITYKNIYYMRPHVATELRVHCHELVHVAQWHHLGAAAFIQRYITEIQKYSYEGAPLERMAYAVDEHFSKGGDKIDIPNYVLKNL